MSAALTILFTLLTLMFLAGAFSIPESEKPKNQRKSRE